MFIFTTTGILNTQLFSKTNSLHKPIKETAEQMTSYIWWKYCTLLLKNDYEIFHQKQDFKLKKKAHNGI